MLCHPDFQRMMLDAEIFVDQIADMRINDMNAVLETVRQMLLAKHTTGQDDLYLRTLELAQVQEEEYFGHVVAEDLERILRDIRGAHKVDRTTADQSSVAVETQAQLQEVMSFEGSAEEKKARFFLANLGIDYDAITKEQFVTLMDILAKSKKLQIRQASQRGKNSPHQSHGRGKRKK